MKIETLSLQANTIEIERSDQINTEIMSNARKKNIDDKSSSIEWLSRLRFKIYDFKTSSY